MAEFVAVEASDHSADLVVFPELATTGYLEPRTGVPTLADQDFARRLYDESEPIPGPTTRLLGKIARENNVHAIIGISERHPVIPGALYNSAAFIGPDGELIAVYHKLHAGIEEKFVYTSGSTVDVYKTQLGNVAINICYDVRFPELARAQTLKGAEIIVSIWATFLQPGKVPSDGILHRCITRAMENAVYFLGCNRSGEEGAMLFPGKGVIVAPSGDVVAQSDHEGENIVRGTLWDEQLRSQRSYMPIFRDRRPELYKAITDPL